LIDSENKDFRFSAEELEEVRMHISKYPDPKSAVMPVLWMAQNKFGWLSDQAMQLVAETLNLSFAHVYGVASFYTMYFKKPMGKYLLEVCTCFSCGECNGREMFAYLKETLQTDENGVSSDALFWVREAECLGACDTAPVLQFNNGHYVHSLTPEKLDKLIKDVSDGKLPEYEQIALNSQAIQG
jgi:NADH-quinone oxidoreductase subunit E